MRALHTVSVAALSLVTSACGGNGAQPRPVVPQAPAALDTPAKASAASLGELELTVTGSPECQRLVREGVLALHSFLYDATLVDLWQEADENPLLDEARLGAK